MERMYGNSENSTLMLTIQHRMHPVINQFISDIFYQGRLENHKATRDKILENQIYKKFNTYKSVMFFDVSDGIETNCNPSIFNNQNIEFVCKLLGVFNKLVKNFSEDTGLITTYNAQVDQYQYRNTFCKISTIDGFQGSEMPFIILDLVKTSTYSFMKDTRLNVALSRAKFLLIIVGSTRCNHSIITKLIEYTRKNESFIEVNSKISEEKLTDLLYKNKILINN